MPIFSWLVFVFWAILIISWIIAGFSAKKSNRGKAWWQREIWIRIGLIIIITLLIHVGAFDNGFFNTFYQSTTLGIIGVILCAAGVALAIWARAYLGRNWGMPMTLQEGHELVTSGPYTWVRHPIYTGFLLAALGSIFADGNIWLIIFIFFGAYFIYSAKTEEKIMSKQFPNEYPQYMKRTKMIIPFIL